MKVILTEQCKSLTGSLGSGFGYYIQRRGKHFYGARKAKGSVPPDGHWRFILTCAQLAKANLHIADIRIDWMELQTALDEAEKFVAAQMVHDNYYSKAKTTYNAADIINLKITFGL